MSRSRKPRRDRRSPEALAPTSGDAPYYVLSEADVDPARLRAERAKARELKKSAWWHRQIQAGLCHYCGGQFAPKELTMDHVVPLARGGKSVQGNLVPACTACNRDKKLETPAEKLLNELE